MKRLSFIFGGLMLLALTACVNEKISLEDQFAGEKITVKAYMPEGNTPSTRVSYTLNDDGNPETTDPFVLSWSDGDAFSVIRGGENQIFTKSEGTNDFTGELPTAGEGTYYAVYPTTSDTNHEKVLFDISNQKDKLPYLMYASSETGKSFQFKHALAYLKLNISIPETFLNDLRGKSYILEMRLPEEYNVYMHAGGYLNISNKTLDFIDYNNSRPSLPTQNIEKSVTIDDNSIEVVFAIPPIPQMNNSNRNELAFFLKENGNYTWHGAYLKRKDNLPIEAGKYYTATINLEYFE